MMSWQEGISKLLPATFIEAGEGILNIESESVCFSKAVMW